MAELNREGTEELDGLPVAVEAVYGSDDIVEGYNVYDDNTDETIGYIFLNQADKWEIADSEIHLAFDNEDFDAALTYLVNKYRKETGK